MASRRVAASVAASVVALAAVKAGPWDDTWGDCWAGQLVVLKVAPKAALWDELVSTMVAHWAACLASRMAVLMVASRDDHSGDSTAVS